MKRYCVAKAVSLVNKVRQTFLSAVCQVCADRNVCATLKAESPTSSSGATRVFFRREKFPKKTVDYAPSVLKCNNIKLNYHRGLLKITNAIFCFTQSHRDTEERIMFNHNRHKEKIVSVVHPVVSIVVKEN